MTVIHNIHQRASQVINHIKIKYSSDVFEISSAQLKTMEVHHCKSLSYMQCSSSNSEDMKFLCKYYINSIKVCVCYISVANSQMPPVLVCSVDTRREV